MADSAEPTEAEVDAVIEEFGGDLRATIRALLHDVAVLASDFAVAVSHGFVRGRVTKARSEQQGTRKADGNWPVMLRCH